MSAKVKELQRDLNRFTNKYLEKFPPLIVDGDRGHATNRRIQTAKWYLGYTGKPQRSSRVTDLFRRRLAHPKNPDIFTKAMFREAADRRRRQRDEAKQPPGPGVTMFDGRKVAKWMKPYLDWARANGWKGTLNSGWRDPEHSEQLCIEMCGKPTCPGKCAGKSSNHVGSAVPKGALDVSDFATFGKLMARMPITKQRPVRIFNALGAKDPVHFSATGH